MQWIYICKCKAKHFENKYSVDAIAWWRKVCKIYVEVQIETTEIAK